MLGERLCKLFDVEYPIIQGGMAWVSRPELVAAVSNAGALGVLAAGGLKPEELRQAIRHTRMLTCKPFAVNLMLWQVLMQGQMEVVVDEGVQIVMTGVGDPRALLVAARRAGITVITAVGAVRHARRAQEAGVDAIVAEGNEAGGHVGKISTLCLVPQVLDAVDLPVIAAGGIGDGRGFAAAFALGVDGVMMGTRFLASVECPAHHHYKQRVLEASAEDAVVIGSVTGTPSRCLQNDYTRARQNIEETSDLPVDQIRAMGIGRLRLAAVEGDVDQGWLPAGQVSGMIDRLQTCREIVEGVTAEGLSILRRLGRLSEEREPQPVG